MKYFINPYLKKEKQMKRKLFLLMALAGMFIILSGISRCNVMQPNNLCDNLLYGDDPWRECMGMYGSDGNEVSEPSESAPAPEAPSEPDPPDDPPDDCKEGPYTNGKGQY